LIQCLNVAIAVNVENGFSFKHFEKII
jgi:hypothetical protein